MLQELREALWGPGTLLLLLGTGLFLMIRLEFLPCRRLGMSLRLALGREARREGEGGVSPFSALMTSLAATVGTGNIVGVSTALLAGGPGALVWMELSALLGLATVYTESLLSAKYRRRGPDGRWTGGPMYVMEAAFGARWGRLAGSLFALFALGMTLGMGAMTQSNAVTGALSDAFAIPVLPGAVLTAALTLLGILGGRRGISRITAVLVPCMAVLYLAAALLVILAHLPRLPRTMLLLFRSAFCPRAAAGGSLGIWAALRWGVARGVFSNEAGLGTAGMTAAAAGGRDPVKQGYISMTGVFFDTMVICTVTGLAVCCSGVLEGGAGNPVELVTLAFRSALGEPGGQWVAASIILFAFTTLLGCAFLGETALIYLTHGRGGVWYRVLFLLAVLWGAVQPSGTVYLLADICNALLCVPNLICLAVMGGEASQLSRRDAKRIERFDQTLSRKRLRESRGGASLGDEESAR